MIDQQRLTWAERERRSKSDVCSITFSTLWPGLPSLDLNLSFSFYALLFLDLPVFLPHSLALFSSRCDGEKTLEVVAISQCFFTIRPD